MGQLLALSTWLWYVSTVSSKALAAVFKAILRKVASAAYLVPFWKGLAFTSVRIPSWMGPFSTLATHNDDEKNASQGATAGEHPIRPKAAFKKAASSVRIEYCLFSEASDIDKWPERKVLWLFWCFCVFVFCFYIEMLPHRSSASSSVSSPLLIAPIGSGPFPFCSKSLHSASFQTPTTLTANLVRRWRVSRKSACMKEFVGWRKMSPAFLAFKRQRSAIRSGQLPHPPAPTINCWNYSSLLNFLECHSIFLSTAAEHFQRHATQHPG
jgi:hypothetical protein